jgi:hypothetical protein
MPTHRNPQSYALAARQERRLTMQEADIRKILRGHQRRNRALQDKLTADKVDLDARCKVDCHFWCPSRAQAEQLARALEANHFSVERLGPAVDEFIPGIWNLEASKLQSIRETISEDFTETITRRAATLECKFDGWGARI